MRKRVFYTFLGGVWPRIEALLDCGLVCEQVPCSQSIKLFSREFETCVLGRVDELFRNPTVAQVSNLVGDEVPS